MTFAQRTESTSVLYDVEFIRKIDFLDLDGETYDSVLVKFKVGAPSEQTVKVDIWNKHGALIYNHTFKKMNCIRCTRDFDDNVIVVGKPSMFFLFIKKCDDGPLFCVIREWEGINKTPDEYLLEYFMKPKKSPKPSSIQEGKIYDVVEQMPQFPDGNGALMKYLSDNISYPAEAEKKGAQGRVIIAFIVECDGSVSNLKVEKSAEDHLDNEALRVVSKMPKWNPGKQGGIPVRVRYTLPITFRLQ